MLPAEADWVGGVLAALPADGLAPVLDIGSGDRAHRTQTQPWIEHRIFAPLAARQVAVRFADVKPAAGVDVVADVCTDAGIAALRAVCARTILCCNVLEHVVDAQRFATRLAALAEPNARLIVTVPHRYPHHRDPIDTMFRPNLEQLAALFPSYMLERGAIVAAGSYRDEFARRPLTLTLRHLLRLPAPFLGWAAWRRSVGKLRYLVGHYQVACACFVKR